jgi:hypothetical protein
VFFVVSTLSGSAAASPAEGVEPFRRRLAIPTPVEAFSAPHAGVSRTIYLERCRGGCLVTGGSINDAENMVSTIPNPGRYTLTEFENTTGETGAAADAEWNMVVQCMREVYSPFDVVVTDVKPPIGPYHLAFISGNPPDVGLDFSILGVAPLAGNCAAFDNVISFSFANAHNQTEVGNRVNNLCWTAAQESAHAFGLDHEFEFVRDGRSACNDPMTYRFDCGGQKFYRNSFARCGEDGVRPCRCGATQNSHKKLLGVFGAGTPITGVPAVTMTNPLPGDTELPVNVIGIASAKRGIARVSLFLNGFPFLEVNGAPFGPIGQPEASYGLLVPDNVPDSIYDVFVRAYDDLGTFTDSGTVTVTKGAPCVSADTCLDEQKCVDGRCLWDPPVGELGDDCTYPQFCKSLLCRGTAEQSICTQTCEPEDPDGCPPGLACTQGVCFFADEGGCCSASGGGWLHAGLLALVVGFVLRRRRRSTNSQSRRAFDITGEVRP